VLIHHLRVLQKTEDCSRNSSWGYGGRVDGGNAKHEGSIFPIGGLKPGPLVGQKAPEPCIHR
jgi:hypothetical protein